MVRANLKRPPPKMRPPVAHSLHQAYELLLVCGELEMTRCEGSTEVGERTVALVQHSAESYPGGVVVHDEWPGEVRHLENGARREGPLQGLECRGGLVIPGEASR